MFNTPSPFRVAPALFLSATAMLPCFSAAAQTEVEVEEYERESIEIDAYDPYGSRGCQTHAIPCDPRGVSNPCDPPMGMLVGYRLLTSSQ